MMSPTVEHMHQNAYRIRKSFLVPFSIDVVLLFILLLLSVFVKGSSFERIVLVIIFVPVFLVLLELLSRRVSTGDDGITIRKFLRKKELRWEDVTHVGTVVLRKKVYLLLTTVKGFYILSNAYEKFSTLVRDIVDRIDAQKVEAEAKKQIEHPVKNVSDIISSWIMALVLAGIISTKLLSS